MDSECLVAFFGVKTCSQKFFYPIHLVAFPTILECIEDNIPMKHIRQYSLYG
ncbi:hypothetical protein BDQ17DRAFT_1370010 [Cyathus striatus]|nr:hypothetical protein BDQ17DRAFT_1370010 [Cyathus striatus]